MNFPTTQQLKRFFKQTFLLGLIILRSTFFCFGGWFDHDQNYPVWMVCHHTDQSGLAATAADRRKNRIRKV
jgi:hypothetical protein